MVGQYLIGAEKSEKCYQTFKESEVGMAGRSRAVERVLIG